MPYNPEVKKAPVPQSHRPAELPRQKRGVTDNGRSDFIGVQKWAWKTLGGLAIATILCVLAIKSC